MNPNGAQTGPNGPQINKWAQPGTGTGLILDQAEPRAWFQAQPRAWSRLRPINLGPLQSPSGTLFIWGSYSPHLGTLFIWGPFGSHLGTQVDAEGRHLGGRRPTKGAQDFFCFFYRAGPPSINSVLGPFRAHGGRKPTFWEAEGRLKGVWGRSAWKFGRTWALLRPRCCYDLRGVMPLLV